MNDREDHQVELDQEQAMLDLDQASVTRDELQPDFERDAQHVADVVQRRTQQGVDGRQDRHDRDQTTQDAADDGIYESEAERRATKIRESAEGIRQEARLNREEAQFSRDEARRLSEAAREDLEGS